jgi:N-acetylneuraminic acid mutarotase
MEISKKSIALSNRFLFMDNHPEQGQKSPRISLSLNKKLKQTFSQNIEQLKNFFPMKSIKILLCLIVFSSMLHAQAWVSRPNFPGTGRSAGVAFTIGNISYVGTGSGNLDFYAFDPSGNSGAGTWSAALTAFPGATDNNVAFVINGKGYVGLGRGGLNDGNGKFLYEYTPNPSGGTWTKKTDFPNNSDNLGVAFAIGNKGYFRSGDITAMQTYNSFWEYDPTANTWTKKTDLGPDAANPTPPSTGLVRRSAAAFAIGGKGYIGTGLDAGVQIDFYEYDPVANSWTQKTNYGVSIPPSMPVASGRFNTVSFSTSTQGYIGLGSDAGENQGQQFWVYTPSSNSWTKLAANFPTASRSQAVGFVINDRPFVGLGNDGVLQKTFYEYNPSAVLSVELTQFSAVMDKSKAQIALNWTTANERDNAYFAVERKGSLEDDFQEIGRIKGTGNSTQNVQYRLLDNQPLLGIAYYRLRTVDYQESAMYSKTVSVAYEKGGKIVVFPSNTEGPITIDVGTQRIDEANIFSPTGQLVLRGNQSQIDLSTLPRGLYFVQVKTANEIAVQKVFKQ